jgi:hypothetical protein
MAVRNLQSGFENKFILGISEIGFGKYVRLLGSENPVRLITKFYKYS